MSPRRSTHLESNHAREQRDGGSGGHTNGGYPGLYQDVGNYVGNQQQQGQYKPLTVEVQRTFQRALMEQQQKLIQQKMEYQQELERRVLSQKDEKDIFYYLIQTGQWGVRPFVGDSNAQEAHRWLDYIERIFELIRVPEEMRLEIVKRFLVSNASEWWKSKEPTMEKADKTTITWQQFREAFLDNYVSLTQQLEYKTEFENIKQREGESIEAFINRFETLLKISPEIMNSDVAKASKFKNALLGEIPTMATLQDITYNAMIDAARKSEIEVKLRQRETQFPIFMGQGSTSSSLSNDITSHRYLRPTRVGFKRSIGSTPITIRQLLNHQFSQHCHKTCFGSGSRENQSKNCPNPQGVKTYGMDSFGTSTPTTSIPAQKENHKDITNAMILQMVQMLAFSK